MKPRFLLVQGRSLDQLGSSIQYFPDNWKDEFSTMKKLGFYGIEWIYDKKSEISNPFLNEFGRKEIKFFSSKYDIHLENIVFDWFLHNPLFLNDKFTIHQKKEKLSNLIHLSILSGFKKIILPLLEKNSVREPSLQDELIEYFHSSTILQSNNIEIHLETDLNPEEELKLIQEIDNKKIKICFDMGNSASYGYDPNVVINTLGNAIGSVHIKDREDNGSSVPLGNGNVNFNDVFKNLKKIDFQGNYSLQIYRNTLTNNFKLLEESLTFITNLINSDNYD
jgi:L-ribulose-5-phosphate 3-epimerase